MISTAAAAWSVYRALPADTQAAIQEKFTSAAYSALAPEAQEAIGRKFTSILEGLQSQAPATILDAVSALFPAEAKPAPAQQSTFERLASYLPFIGNAVAASSTHKFTGPSLDADDFEMVPVERAKTIELATQLFVPTDKEEKVYSLDELCQPLSLSEYGPEKPYLRRAEHVVPSFNTRNYHSYLISRIIHQYLGSPEKKSSMCLLLPCVYIDDASGLEQAALDHLNSRLHQNDPIALQVAALLSQLVGKDSSCMPRDSESILNQLEPAKIVTVERGNIEFQKRYDGTIEFTIVGDAIGVLGPDQEGIIGFEMNRTVTIGYPAVDGSVACTKVTYCQKVHESSVE